MEHKTGVAEEIQKAFGTLEMSKKRPDLNGARVKHPLYSSVYLIDRGQKRGIPNPGTYNNLFKDWNGKWLRILTGCKYRILI
jgi:hypothetical protein